MGPPHRLERGTPVRIGGSRELCRFDPVLRFANTGYNPHSALMLSRCPEFDFRVALFRHS
ncbi:hypothetical protein Lsha_0830 [Legionella shakespearei DSM 23087]|uniref:Uncharacterized protein n=1 Tax=Legionella shakespearei DSM 23087 TaxID=1122169 RepID=A0A0W0Z1K9_9GAMM|nr:hypothetical protein Lsha_0830 [Legionella shakespearei DSM 23087]